MTEIQRFFRERLNNYLITEPSLPGEAGLMGCYCMNQLGRICIIFFKYSFGHFFHRTRRMYHGMIRLPSNYKNDNELSYNTLPISPKSCVSKKRIFLGKRRNLPGKDVIMRNWAFTHFQFRKSRFVRNGKGHKPWAHTMHTIKLNSLTLGPWFPLHPSLHGFSYCPFPSYFGNFFIPHRYFMYAL